MVRFSTIFFFIQNSIENLIFLHKSVNFPPKPNLVDQIRIIFATSDNYYLLSIIALLVLWSNNSFMWTKSVNNFQFDKLWGDEFSSASIMCKGKIIIAMEYVTLCLSSLFSKEPLAVLELLLQIQPTLRGAQIEVGYTLWAERVIEFLQILAWKIVRKFDFRRDSTAWMQWW